MLNAYAEIEQKILQVVAITGSSYEKIAKGVIEKSTISKMSVVDSIDDYAVNYIDKELKNESISCS